MEGDLRARGGRGGVRGSVRGWRQTARRCSSPSVRKPCERAGVSRFSAAALAPPLNKTDLEKKKKWSGKKKKMKPRGDSPHPPCRERPPTPQGPSASQTRRGPTASLLGAGRGQKLIPPHPTPGEGAIPGGWGLSQRRATRPLPLGRNLAPRDALRPHPSPFLYPGLSGAGWGERVVETPQLWSLMIKCRVILCVLGDGVAHPTSVNC